MLYKGQHPPDHMLKLSLLVCARLYSSDGYVQTPDGKSPIDINNLLLRGSILRKTPWAIGMALNVGSDSKIVQNMTQAPRKVGSTRWTRWSVAMDS